MTGKLLFGLGGAGTLSGAGIGTYLYTKDSIWNHVKDRVLGNGSEFNDSWKFKFNQMKGESQDGFPELEKIKKQYSSDETRGGEALKHWCSKAYSYTYKSAFSSEDKSLLQKIEKYCIQSLGEKFTSLLQNGHKLLGNGTSESQTDYDTNYKKIETYATTKEGKLPAELKSLKSNNSASKWSVLQDWCRGIQSIPFTKEGDTFKVGKELCIKTN
ncbi:hypothetical protein HF1_02000 [Mycoplasma haemofelis str. Langford 1]|uniref:Uncharacterized protein n=1 Tax=Mycoplasma haemofelis (strain Langford 1) TaxID=941640 RepID=E8ZKP2_MYCHL|nr:hypothetical protein [Mycoplasma haemofelis]CBY92208.1 hypothetical protein HF1_02000 [Mycoplasma haemofelis str. Langford 1]